MQISKPKIWREQVPVLQYVRKDIVGRGVTPAEVLDLQICTSLRPFLLFEIVTHFQQAHQGFIGFLVGEEGGIALVYHQRFQA